MPQAELGQLGVGLIGLGQIARRQHVGAIAAIAGLQLVATADPGQQGLPDMPHFASLDSMLASGTPVDAVAICTPPALRYDIAAAALRAGKHVLLEKPPGATVAELEELSRNAERAGVTLFTAWHAQHAPAIAPARDVLAGQAIASIDIIWKEDVRVWHPGQDWIWREGGFGVFDPGSNALSILCALVPGEIAVHDSVFTIPANCHEPIAAHLRLAAGQVRIAAVFDWRISGLQCWNIIFSMQDGSLVALTEGGKHLSVGGVPVPCPAEAEYTALYEHFAGLIRRRRSDVFTAPLRLIEACYAAARRLESEPFQ